MQPFDSARLHFRPLGAADAPGMLVPDPDPALRRYLAGIGGPHLPGPAQSAAATAAIEAQYRTAGLCRWAVLLRTTGDFMGWAGLKRVAGPVNGKHDSTTWATGSSRPTGARATAARPPGPGSITPLGCCARPAFAPTPTPITWPRGASWKKWTCGPAVRLSRRHPLPVVRSPTAGLALGPAPGADSGYPGGLGADTTAGSRRCSPSRHRRRSSWKAGENSRCSPATQPTAPVQPANTSDG